VKRSPLPALLLMLVLLPALTAAGAGTTIYVHRVVAAAPGNITIGDLVQASGDVPPAAAETLARSVAVMGDKVLYVPTGEYRAQLEAGFGPGAILVGSRSTIIPQGSALASQTYLVDRMMEWLQSQHLLADAKTEIAVTQITARGAPPQDGTPVFQVVKAAPAGTDVTFSLSGTGGGSVTGKLAVAGQRPGTTADGVKAGTAVNVVFRKGLITIEMPGRTLASASVGDTVSVSIPDSQRTFTGQVLDGKAVQVDLP